MRIIAGSASKSTAEDLSKLLNTKLVDVAIKRFIDGECYVRINEEVKGEDIVIVQTTYPDKNIVELFLLQDAAIEAGAKSIFLVIPYYGYSRQDKKFEDGEPISARAIAEHLSLHADGVITVDPHKEHILDFFKIPAYSCSATAQIGNYLKEKVDMVLAPDKGAVSRAKAVAEIINCDYDFLEKRRIDDTTIEIKTKKMDVDGRKVAIVDDIISTGGTMARAAQEIKKQGAVETYIACTHGLFVGNALEKLMNSGCKEILSTDTVVTKFSKIKIAPEIANKMREVGKYL